MDRIGKGPSLVEVGLTGFPPQQIGVGREGEAAGDAMVEPSAIIETEEAFRACDRR